jgi:hypothetical protein
MRCVWEREGNVRVDGADHAVLAMPTLGAVEPDGLLVPNGNGVGQDVGCGAESSVGGHEA